LKKDVSKLEREISIKIQENQMKQLDAAQDISVDVNEVPFVKIEANKPKALLPKKLVNEGKVNKLRV